MATNNLTDGERLVSRDHNNFNLLRLIAAFLVIFSHSYAFLVEPKADFLTRLTNSLIPTLSVLGLYFFFIISGFLVANSFKNSKGVSSFLWKRCLRIFPGLFVCLMVTVFIFGPLTTILPLNEYFGHPDTYEYLWKGIGLYNIEDHLPGVFEYNPLSRPVNGSLWTLRYEFSFYLLLAGLGFLFFSKRSALKLGLVAVSLLGLAAYVYEYQITGNILGLYLGWHQVGVFGALFFLGALGLELRNHLKFNFVTAFILSIIVFGFLRNTEIAFYLKLIVLTYITLWLAIIPLPQKVNDWFNNFDLSYGFYIYAFPIGQALAGQFYGTLNGGSLALLTMLCTLPFALLSWLLVEKPALRFKFKHNKNVIAETVAAD